MSVLKESEGVCLAQGKGIRWYSAPHLRQALQVTTAQGGEGEFFFFPSPAKVFNLVKPEGLSRCLIIKGVWTKGYSKPAGATNWTFSSVFDGWLPSEIVCFPRCVCVKLPQKTPRDLRCPFSLLKRISSHLWCFTDAATCCDRPKRWTQRLISLEVNARPCSALESLVYDAALILAEWNLGGKSTIAAIWMLNWSPLWRPSFLYSPCIHPHINIKENNFLNVTHKSN